MANYGRIALARTGFGDLVLWMLDHAPRFPDPFPEVPPGETSTTTTSTCNPDSYVKVTRQYSTGTIYYLTDFRQEVETTEVFSGDSVTGTHSIFYNQATYYTIGPGGNPFDPYQQLPGFYVMCSYSWATFRWSRPVPSRRLVVYDEEHARPVATYYTDNGHPEKNDPSAFKTRWTRCYSGVNFINTMCGRVVIDYGTSLIPSKLQNDCGITPPLGDPPKPPNHIPPNEVGNLVYVPYQTGIFFPVFSETSLSRADSIKLLQNHPRLSIAFPKITDDLSGGLFGTVPPPSWF
jgi:hypothetical protein